METLNSTIATVPTREYIFVLTDANARTGRKGEDGEEADSKVLGEYGRDVLKQNGKPLLHVFRRRQQAPSSEHFFVPPKVAGLSRSKAPTVAIDKHAWTIF